MPVLIKAETMMISMQRWCWTGRDTTEVLRGFIAMMPQRGPARDGIGAARDGISAPDSTLLNVENKAASSGAVSAMSLAMRLSACRPRAFKLMGGYLHLDIRSTM